MFNINILTSKYIFFTYSRI